MPQHPNAKLTPRGRETLVSHIESGLGVAEAARKMGTNRQERLRIDEGSTPHAPSIEPLPACSLFVCVRNRDR